LAHVHRRRPLHQAGREVLRADRRVRSGAGESRDPQHPPRYPVDPRAGGQPPLATPRAARRSGFASAPLCRTRDTVFTSSPSPAMAMRMRSPGFAVYGCGGTSDVPVRSHAPRGSVYTAARTRARFAGSRVMSATLARPVNTDARSRSTVMRISARDTSTSQASTAAEAGDPGRPLLLRVGGGEAVDLGRVELRAADRAEARADRAERQREQSVEREGVQGPEPPLAPEREKGLALTPDADERRGRDV